MISLLLSITTSTALMNFEFRGIQNEQSAPNIAFHPLEAVQSAYFFHLFGVSRNRTNAYGVDEPEFLICGINSGGCP